MKARGGIAMKIIVILRRFMQCTRLWQKFEMNTEIPTHAPFGVVDATEFARVYA
jgi:hypothetical protein